ncbi:hypothetical protein [Absidia glauca]|uniref:Uncharacterized protein n=1 Tax=Absidia glauca TaxID=4829 RepID=A0A163LNJ7_ABSGL|nr:hypothetical protein [Absidia glauca]
MYIFTSTLTGFCRGMLLHHVALLSGNPAFPFTSFLCPETRRGIWYSKPSVISNVHEAYDQFQFTIDHSHIPLVTLLQFLIRYMFSSYRDDLWTNRHQTLTASSVFIYDSTTKRLRLKISWKGTRPGLPLISGPTFYPKHQLTLRPMWRILSSLKSLQDNKGENTASKRIVHPLTTPVHTLLPHAYLSFDAQLCCCKREVCDISFAPSDILAAIQLCPAPSSIVDQKPFYTTLSIIQWCIRFWDFVFDLQPACPSLCHSQDAHHQC